MPFDQLSKTLPEISPKTSNLPSAEISSTTLSGSEAARAATVLLGCFRKGDAADPETYVKAITAIFSGYDEEIVRGAIDPRYGLPSKAKFLPTVSEVRDECELLMAPRYAAAKRLAAEHETLARREKPRSEEEQAEYDAEHEKISSRYDSFREEVRERAEKVEAGQVGGYDHMLALATMKKRTDELKAREWGALGLEPQPYSVAFAKLMHLPPFSKPLSDHLGLKLNQTGEEAA